MTTLPASRIPALRGGPTLRWGILAPGHIARNWAGTVLANTDQPIVAVAGRNPANAAAFAAELGIGRVHPTIEGLLADPEIDAVYVASTNELHRPHALAAIAAGKHVLVEKPVGCTAAEAREIAVAARAAGVFVMEAMWTRFLPQTDVAIQLVEGGSLGRSVALVAEFSHRIEPVEGNRVHVGTIGGGALLDLGVYPIAFAHHLLGPIESFEANGTLTAAGVDATTSLSLRHVRGGLTSALVSLETEGPWAATLLGTDGRIEWASAFFTAGSFRFVPRDGEPAVYSDPNGLSMHEGLCYQAVVMAAHVAEGRAGSPWHTLEDAAAVLEVIDEARRRIGAIAPPATSG